MKQVHPDIGMDNKSALKELVGYGGPDYWLYRGTNGYSMREGTITDEMIDAHLSGDTPLGMNIASAERKSRFLIFDIDDHDGKLDPAIVGSRSGAIAGALGAHKIPFFAVRSGGGCGVHLWVVFEREFSSDQIINSGKKVLETATTILQTVWPNEIFTVGTKGLFADSDTHQIEIFPKGQKDHYNVALPLSRKSRALRVDGVDENGFAHLVDGDELKIEFARQQKSGPKAKEASIDYDAAFDAFISRYDVETYDQWGAAALCLISAFERKDGPRSDWARERWTAWSKTADAYKHGDEQKWFNTGTSQFSPITFWLYAKESGYTGGTPYNKTESRKLTALSFLDDVRLLRDDVGVGYAQIGDRNFMPIRSTAFKHHVTLGLFNDKGLTPDDTTLNSVVNYADALASQTDREAVWLRFAQAGASRYVFLADDLCQVVEIDAAGWRVVDDPPVVFRRGDCLPMPVPQKGELSEFCDFLNVGDDEIPFLLAWMVTAMYFPGQACPIALLDGPAGSGKSSALRTIIETIDPKVGAQAGEPKSEDDLFAAAYNAGTVSGDNFSSIAKISDPLCRLSTGGGIRKRKLYTDFESVSMSAKRPIIIAGIDPTFYAADLSERIVRIRLNRPDEYLNDMQFESMLKEKRARFTGALLDLVVLCINEADQIEYSGSRFATFCRVGEVIARHLGRPDGWFVERMAEKSAEEMADLEHSDSVFEFLTRQIASSGVGDRRWEANSKQLWESMQEQIEVGHLKVARDDVPRSPKGMGSRVERAIPMLKQHGVRVERGPRRTFIFEWDDSSQEAIDAVIEMASQKSAF
ncbi:TOTE conflict system archaeo-eukaryotic primase domain-containing protein [Aliiroseovarius crassostreae]|uniref:TOTE conflict system archaeo-eukaryotic primase domain-containing protein n=1 Tax=Aliiroseovarius crassostreae TaxID=154981 RepID=UPI003C7AF19C